MVASTALILELNWLTSSRMGNCVEAFDLMGFQDFDAVQFFENPSMA